MTRFIIVLAALGSLALPVRDAVAQREPVAILATVEGDVWMTIAGTPERTPRRFERLSADVVLRTGASGRALVVFRTGVRVLVQSSSRVRLHAGRAEVLSGVATPLEPVPTVPLVAPVSGAGTTITAVRIRAGAIAVLEPPPGASTLADTTVLAFAPASAAAHEVVVEDADGAVAYRADVERGRVMVPRGILRPDTHYRWRVRGTTAAGFAADGGGDFHTLAESLVRDRARLRAALAGADLASDALLAEVDLSLGLWSEALASFRRVQRGIGIGADTVIDERVALLEARMASRVPGNR